MFGGHRFPALTGWARLFRAYGAGGKELFESAPGDRKNFAISCLRAQFPAEPEIIPDTRALSPTLVQQKNKSDRGALAYYGSSPSPCARSRPALPRDSPLMTEPFLTILDAGLGVVLLVIFFSVMWNRQKHKRRKD
jgi:hypothetical protein